MRCAIAALAVFAASLAGCGAGAKQATSSRGEEDRRDNLALQQQVDRQVDERVSSALEEEEAGTDSMRAYGVTSNTVCTKQSATAYKCLTTFQSPPGTPNVVTDVTCGRDGGNCITETR